MEYERVASKKEESVIPDDLLALTEALKDPFSYDTDPEIYLKAKKNELDELAKAMNQKEEEKQRQKESELLE